MFERTFVLSIYAERVRRRPIGVTFITYNKKKAVAPASLLDTKTVYKWCVCAL